MNKFRILVVFCELLAYLWRQKYGELAYLFDCDDLIVRAENITIVILCMVFIKKMQRRTTKLINKYALTNNYFIIELNEVEKYMQSIYNCAFNSSQEELLTIKLAPNFMKAIRLNRIAYDVISYLGRSPIWNLNHPLIRSRVTAITSIRSLLEESNESHCPICKEFEMNENSHFVILNCCKHLFCVFCADGFFDVKFTYQLEPT